MLGKLGVYKISLTCHHSHSVLSQTICTQTGMHLINTKTLKLEEHVTPGPYAILSHTWCNNEEVLYRDFTTNIGSAKKGHRKIEYLCTQAVQDGLEYAWIDTVCIDKSSSSELSESINSMFAWYRNAQMCYVYLDDVDHVSEIPGSRWLTRGWTLQELLAPYRVRFYSRDWTLLGTKASLVADLVRCTRIDQNVLMNPSQIAHHSAATRMSWAAGRRTTRTEDVAYCLLGIFDVNIPLLYGEGKKAFRRLQEEILRQHSDVTILAFHRQLGPRNHFDGGIFASSPDVFGQQPRIVRQLLETPCEVLNRGLQLELRTIPALPGDSDHQCLILSCRYEYQPDQLLALPVYRVGEQRTYAVYAKALRTFPVRLCINRPYEDVLLLSRGVAVNTQEVAVSNRHTCALKAASLIAHGYEVIYATPELAFDSWNAETLVSEVVSSHFLIIRRFGFVHRKHNEGFILTFASRQANSQSRRVFCRVDTMPPMVDPTAWLEQQEMNSLLKPPPVSSEWYKPEGWNSIRMGLSKTIDGLDWQLVSAYEGFEHPLHASPGIIEFELQSRQCFRAVSIVISLSLNASPYWTISIHPEGHG